MFKQPKMLMMIPVLVYSGFRYFFFGIFSEFSTVNLFSIVNGQPQWTFILLDLSWQLLVHLIHLVIILTFFLHFFSGSIILGRLSDKIGKKPVLIFSTICALFAYLLTAEFFVKLEQRYIFFVIAILLGNAQGITVK